MTPPAIAQALDCEYDFDRVSTASPGKSWEPLVRKGSKSVTNTVTVDEFYEWALNKQPALEPIVKPDNVSSILPASEQKKLKDKFERLYSTWQNETMMLSSITQMALHPMYQQIIGMGEEVVPLILMKMSKEPDMWFWALRSITGEDPVPAEHKGQIRKMTQDWLAWGKDNGFI